MNNIPLHVRKELEADPYYHICCVTSVTAATDKIEWHHNFIFAGKQVQEKWCILPLAKAIHDMANRKDIKEKLDWIMLNRASIETLAKYSKAIDLIKKCSELNKKYANEKNQSVLQSIGF